MHATRCGWARGLGVANVVIVAALLGCSTAADPAPSGTAQDEVIGGVESDSLPSAVLLNRERADGTSAACTGTLITNRHVLTAGHCIKNAAGDRDRRWYVTSPSTGKASHANVAFESPGNEDRSHDVAIVLLKTAIEVKALPVLPARRPVEGGGAVFFGRVQDGVVSNSAVFRSPVLAISYAGVEAAFGVGTLFFGLVTPSDAGDGRAASERGDSGSAVVARGKTGVVILGVLFGRDINAPDRSFASRIDTVGDWIRQVIDQT